MKYPWPEMRKTTRRFWWPWVVWMVEIVGVSRRCIVTLHKNATCCFNQILEEASHKIAPMQPITSHLLNPPSKRTRHVGHCRRSRDQLISDSLPWTPTHRRDSVSRLVRIYIHQRCADTRCSLEDLLGSMARDN